MSIGTTSIIVAVCQCTIPYASVSRDRYLSYGLETRERYSDPTDAIWAALAARQLGKVVAIAPQFNECRNGRMIYRYWISANGDPFVETINYLDRLQDCDHFSITDDALEIVIE